MSKLDINSLLGRLGLKATNPGAWSGSHGWSTARESTLINVRNPTDGSLIAQMRPASAEDYENVIASALEAAAAWRRVPAPKRGEAVRLLGDELRRHNPGRRCGPEQQPDARRLHPPGQHLPRAADQADRR